MSLSPDPSVRDLGDCGCCEGVAAETPSGVTNRPGLSAIAYRVGTHRSFKASMLAGLSAGRSPGLAALTTRDDDDFTIALLDGWATTLDVLTFYQERIATESYLRTATERLSLLELARQIGYELSPGVAASTELAFTLETAPGSPPVVTIDVGVKAQSIPGPDERPQTFETIEKVEARAGWNAIRPLLTQPQTLTATMGELWLEGTATNLKTGDRLLVVSPKPGGGVVRTLRRAAAVTSFDEAGRTRVGLEPQVDPFGRTESAAISEIGVWALRAKAAPFGHNAPKFTSVKTTGGTSTPEYTEWELDEPDEKQMALDSVYDQIATGSFVVIDRPVIYPELRWQVFARVTNVRTTAPARYGMSGRATTLTLDVSWMRTFFFWFPVPDAFLDVVRETAAYVQSEPLALGEAPRSVLVKGDTIDVGPEGSGLGVGRRLAVSGKEANGKAVTEIATIAAVSTAGGITTLTLAQNLGHAYVRESMTVNANVVAATHGETVTEALGSGDAGRPYQRFVLRQPPLTYVSSSDPSGGTSTLQVRVNDVLWAEAPTLYRRGQRERVYVTRTDDGGRTTVQFGDGNTGSRPPSGTDNIRATYRKGTGAAGNVDGDRLSLLMTRPLGVAAVTNPEAAAGGADPERRDDARRNAPLTVLTLGRVVSLRDYEDFARAFGGIAKASATWTWNGQTYGVFVTVAGEGGAEVKTSSPTYVNLASALRSSGDPHVPLEVKSFSKKRFRIDAQVTRQADYLGDKVKAAVEGALRRHFSFEAREFGQPVSLSEVMAVVQGVPGVLGVDVNALYRNDLVGGDGLVQPLPAGMPQIGSSGAVNPAELLFLDESALSITVS